MTLDDTTIATIRTAITGTDRQLRDLERIDGLTHSQRAIIGRIRGIMAAAIDGLADLRDTQASR
jgi:hypothetical protein